MSSIPSIVHVYRSCILSRIGSQDPRKLTIVGRMYIFEFRTHIMYSNGVRRTFESERSLLRDDLSVLFGRVQNDFPKNVFQHTYVYTWFLSYTHGLHFWRNYKGSIPPPQIVKLEFSKILIKNNIT